MRIYGIQKLTLLDFPDRTACTLFTGGCNLRCPFCHNAPLVRMDAEPLDDGELFAYLRKRRNLLEGVCVTGGEPLLHPDIDTLLAELKELGYEVKLDTNGTYPDRLQEIVARRLVDYIAMDIKSSPAGYAAAVGIPDFDIAPVDESIHFLLGGTVSYEFRTTAVGGLHTLDDFAAIGDWIAGAEKYFIQNYSDLGDILGGGEGFRPFSNQELQTFLAAVSPKVKYAALRGV
ncbi:MAG: anaerobic ribonucleoside-triphosphate reductase activating protein [Eubacteriales bacterium]|jgi:pyruvate formate lyase activating enzyme|nr:anaerobic ribonucleoside-triphosphate reductase activating protein [Clostridiales bacterium]